MKTRLLGIGTYPDLVFHDGRLWCVWQQGAVLELVSLDPDTLEEQSRAAITIGKDGAFPKLCSSDGGLWLAYREGQAPWRIVLRGIGNSHEEYLDVGHGMHPVAFGAGEIAWQATGAPIWEVWRRPIAGGEKRLVRRGVGTGLSRVLPGSLVTTMDEDRGALPGYTQPSWAGDLVVAEGPTGGTFCQLQDGRELLLWAGQDAKTPRCAEDWGRLAMVAWGETGIPIATVTRAEFLPPGEATVVVPLARAVFVGGFYVTTDKYPEVVPDYPQNIEVIVEASAIWRARTPVIASPDALSGVTDPTRIIGLYVAAEEEGTASALDFAAQMARATWQQRFPTRPMPAVVGYVTRGMVARPTWPPRSVDVFAPECYFDSTPSVAGVEALVAGWTHVLSATRPWLLVCQAYDRNGTQALVTGAYLAPACSAYLDALRARPWILGLLWFAINRPGGVRDYPSLLAAHRRIFAAVPSAPATLPSEDEPVHKPGIDVVKFGPVLSESGTWELHVKDRNKAGIEFKVKFVNGDLKVEWTNDGWGPLSDFTGSRRHVDIKD